MLTRDELQVVIAHELAHIKNRDVLFMTMVGIMMGTIVLLADLGLRSMLWGGGSRRRTSRDNGGQVQMIIMVVALVFIILSPVIAQLIYFAISRKREYLADAGAVQFTRYPLGLAGALEKIGSSTAQLKSATKATAPMYIANPFKGKGQNKQVEVFYSLANYEKWKLKKLKGWEIKYYKGLGTSTTQDVKETFGKRVILYNIDENAKRNLNMSFKR